MPKIEPYVSQVTPQGQLEGRQAHASDFGDFSGLGQFAKSLGQVGEVVQKYNDETDVADTAKNMSQFKIDQTNYLQELKKTGSVPDTFAQDLENHLSQISDQVKTKAGREYFDKHANVLREEFMTNAVSVTSQIAAQKTALDFETTKNNLMNDARSSPTTWQTNIEMLGGRVDQSVQSGRGFTFEHGVKLKEQTATEIAQAAVLGYADNDPKDAKNRLMMGEFDSYLGPREKEAALRTVDQIIRGERAEQDRLRSLAEKAKKERQDTIMNKFISKVYDDGLSTKEVVNAPDLTYLQRENMLNFIHRTATNTAKNDPTVTNGIYKDIMSENTTIFSPDQIIEKVGRGLDAKNAQWLVKALETRKSPEGVAENKAKMMVVKEAEKALLKNPILGPDPEGQRRLNAWTSDFETKWLEARKAGISAKELTDPKNANYIGNTIQGYKATFKEVMDAKMQSMRPAPKTGASTTQPSGMAVGTIKPGKDGNYRYNGGDPKDKKSWSRI